MRILAHRAPLVGQSDIDLAKVIEAKGSHSIYVSQPDATVAAIEEAAKLVA